MTVGAVRAVKAVAGIPSVCLLIGVVCCPCPVKIVCGVWWIAVVVVAVVTLALVRAALTGGALSQADEKLWRGS